MTILISDMPCLLFNMWCITINQQKNLIWFARGGCDQPGQRSCRRPGVSQNLGSTWVQSCSVMVPGRSSWSLRSHMVQCMSLWSDQQQQVPLTLLVVIRTKQIIGLKLGSCFFLLPAAAACLSTNNLITELGSARSHTETNTHTHLQIPALSVKELPSQLSLFVVPLILRPFGGNRGSVVWLVSCL